MAGAVIHRQKARREAFFVVVGDLLRAVHRPGWFCDISHRPLKEYHRTTLKRNLSDLRPPPAAGFPGGGSAGGGVLRRYILLLIMGIGDEVCIFL